MYFTVTFTDCVCHRQVQVNGTPKTFSQVIEGVRAGEKGLKALLRRSAVPCHPLVDLLSIWALPPALPVRHQSRSSISLPA